VRATNLSGVGKDGEKCTDFQPISRYIFETTEDRHTVTIED